MQPVIKLSGFAVVLAAALGVGGLAGNGFGPASARDVRGSGSHAHAEPAVANENAEVPQGLAVERDGYRLVLHEPVETPGSRRLSFTVLAPSGRPLTSYDERHERRLHLIVVRRDLTGFQHVHPVLDESTGRWTAPVRLSPGSWRVFADFDPTGSAQPMTLGSDLAVPGDVARPQPMKGKRSDVVDGYRVRVSGHLRAGHHSMLTLRVTKDGRAVDDLQPYLGAYGHLVALRGGDLAYLHVHPDGEPGDGRTSPGPDIVFGTEVPSAGTYHLFLDFRHGGVVRTADFVLTAGAS